MGGSSRSNPIHFGRRANSLHAVRNANAGACTTSRRRNPAVYHNRARESIVAAPSISPARSAPMAKTPHTSSPEKPEPAIPQHHRTAAQCPSESVPGAVGIRADFTGPGTYGRRRVVPPQTALPRVSLNGPPLGHLTFREIRERRILPWGGQSDPRLASRADCSAKPRKCRRTAARTRLNSPILPSHSLRPKAIDTGARLWTATQEPLGMGAPRDAFKNHESAGTRSFTPESPMIPAATSTRISGTSIPPVTSPGSDAVPPQLAPALWMMIRGRREGQPSPDPAPLALSLA